MGDDVSFCRRQVNGLLQGSLLALTLFNIYTNDLPVRAMAAGCCALQAETFSKIECTADLAHLAKYCQLWHLKPSTSKTVTNVFHLHNNWSHCELNVLAVRVIWPLRYQRHCTELVRVLPQ